MWLPFLPMDRGPVRAHRRGSASISSPEGHEAEAEHREVGSHVAGGRVVSPGGAHDELVEHVSERGLAEELGRLGLGREHALDLLAQVGVEGGEVLEGLVEREQIEGLLLRGEDDVVERDRRPLRAALERRPSRRVVDEHRAHRPGRDAQEVGVPVPFPGPLADEPDPGLVQVRRRLQGVVRPLHRERAAGDAVELLLDQRREIVGRALVTVAEALVELGDLALVGHAPRVPERTGRLPSATAAGLRDGLACQANGPGTVGRGGSRWTRVFSPVRRNSPACCGIPPPMRLNSYEDWRECIEVHCGIPLTQDFIRERLAELSDGTHPRTRDFERLYGAQHLQRTIQWFQQAAEETSTA
ncbi:MAG: hypothetical protein AAGI22_18845 [Planctomycetota bacterium]